MKKKLLIIGGIVLGVYILFNVFWFVWREMKFNEYVLEGMEQVDLSAMVPRYYYNDEDGYSWFVKYPDYLSFTGNITVMVPTIMDDEDVHFDDTLIIWPKIFGDFEYGMFIHEGEDVFQIYIDTQGSAIDSDADDLVERHKSNVVILLQKANENWKLP